MKSMSENEVVKIFSEYKNQIVSQIGTKITDNEQLDKLAYKLIPNFRGTFSIDTITLNKCGSYIVNNQTSKQAGEHWVAVLVTAKTVYVFDTFGRKSKKFLPMLTKNAKLLGKKVVDSDYDVDQKISSMICGQLSIAWLLTVRQLGIKNSLKI